MQGVVDGEQSHQEDRLAEVSHVWVLHKSYQGACQSEDAEDGEGRQVRVDVESFQVVANRWVLDGVGEGLEGVQKTYLKVLLTYG